ncbi:PEP phosphonomutase-like protein [Phaeosphaeriaceae sp. PMI808]|nr:PEP phosphonomutase-like protein [Phaeosphaeriaceae sp. PMI808]
MAYTIEAQNDLADKFRALHQPGNPLILTNVWDAITAEAIASLPKTKALATASYAVAAAAGLADEDLTLDINLRAAKVISGVARAHNLPLTVDFQDGFGTQLLEGTRQIIELGAVGINLEDFNRETGALFSIDEAQERIRSVMYVAQSMGVENFVVNARTDALFTGGTVDEAIERGRAYLEAGAFNVFIWSGSPKSGWPREEVEMATKALRGRLNVILARSKPDGLSVAQLKEIGVSRISMGPYLMRGSVSWIEQEAIKIQDGDGL